MQESKRKSGAFESIAIKLISEFREKHMEKRQGGAK